MRAASPGRRTPRPSGRRAARRTFGDRGQRVSVERQLESAAQSCPGRWSNERPQRPRPFRCRSTRSPTRRSARCRDGACTSAPTSGRDHLGRQLRPHLLRRPRARAGRPRLRVPSWRTDSRCWTSSDVQQVQLERPRHASWDEYDVLRATEPLRAGSCCAALERAAAGLHLRAAVPRQLRRRALLPGARDPVPRRVQRLRDLDEPELRRRRLRARGAASSRSRTRPSGRRRSITRRLRRSVKDSLVARGVPAAKILVNPNGVDPARYAAAGAGGPARELRRALGFDDGRLRDRLHRHLRRLARHRRARGGAADDLRAGARTRSFLLIGDGHARADRRRGGASTGCTDRVREHGPRAAAARARGCWAPATSSSRRTAATWSTARSSARRPSSSSTWRSAAASSRATSSRSARCCRPALRPADLDAAAPAVATQRAVLCRAGRRRRVRRAPSPGSSRGRSWRARWGATRGRRPSTSTRGKRHVGRLWAALAAVPGVREAGPD